MSKTPKNHPKGKTVANLYIKSEILSFIDCNDWNAYQNL